MADKRIYELPDATTWDGYIPQDKSGGTTQRVSVAQVETRLIADGFAKTDQIPAASAVAPADLAASAGVGASNAFARADHAHKKPSAAAIGAADASHQHSTDDLTSGFLPVERGGTGTFSIPSGFLTFAGSEFSAIPIGESTVPFYKTANGGLVPLTLGAGLSVSSGLTPSVSVDRQGGVVASGVYGGEGLEEQDICVFQTVPNMDDIRIRGYASVGGARGVSDICTLRIYDDTHKYLEKSFKAGEAFVIDVMLGALNNAFITITTIWDSGSSTEMYTSLLSGFNFTGDTKITGQGISDPVYNYVVLHTVSVI